MNLRWIMCGHDAPHVVGVAGDGVVEVHLHPQVLQAALEGVRRGLGGVLGDGHAAHKQTLAPEGIDEPQHVLIVGDAQVAPDLVLLDVGGVDGHHDLHAVLQLLQHAQLAVRLKAGEHPGGVVVIKELAAELQVQLAAELGNTLPDVGGLGVQITLIVKSDPVWHMILRPCSRHGPSPSLFAYTPQILTQFDGLGKGQEKSGRNKNPARR